MHNIREILSQWIDSSFLPTVQDPRSNPIATYEVMTPLLLKSFFFYHSSRNINKQDFPHVKTWYFFPLPIVSPLVNNHQLVAWLATRNKESVVHYRFYETTQLPLYGAESLWPCTPLHTRLPAVRGITLCRALGQAWLTSTSGAIRPLSAWTAQCP